MDNLGFTSPFRQVNGQVWCCPNGQILGIFGQDSDSLTCPLFFGDNDFQSYPLGSDKGSDSISHRAKLLAEILR